MASTRNNNTLSNYCLHTDQIKRQEEWLLDSTSRIHNKPAIPCAGVMNPSLPASALSTNPIEVENYLFGISANNFINPVPTPTPQLVTLPAVKFFDRVPLMIPKLPQAPMDQRPFPL